MGNSDERMWATRTVIRYMMVLRNMNIFEDRYAGMNWYVRADVWRLVDECL